MDLSEDTTFMALGLVKAEEKTLFLNTCQRIFKIILRNFTLCKSAFALLG